MLRGIFRVAAIAMLGILGEVRAQGVAVTDPTGGVAPEALYCPSTGGCYTSRFVAEAAMRAGTPNVGTLLVEDYTRGGYIAYRVPDQSPIAYGRPLFGIDYDGTIGGRHFCPNSSATDSRQAPWGDYYCYDEAELIQGFINTSKGCGWRSCAHHGYSTVGSYLEPYQQVSQQALEDYTGARRVTYLETYNDAYGNETVTRSNGLVRVTPFTCPAGMEAISTYDTSVNPQLCRSGAQPYIRIIRGRQMSACPLSSGACSPGTGNQTIAEEDFAFAGRTFVRRYHSLREISAPEIFLGNGWTIPYSTKVQEYSGVIKPDGTFARYSYVSTDRYAVPEMGDAILEKLANGSWTLTESNGDVSAFDFRGTLTSIRNANDSSRDVTLTYESYSYNYVPRLATAVDASGRQLTFHYVQGNTLQGITLPDGRTLAFGYDQNGNLVSVSSGDGYSRQYHYGEVGLATGGDTGLLTGVTSEDGQRTASYGYDIYGRAVLSARQKSGTAAVDIARTTYTSANTASVTTSSGDTRSIVFDSWLFEKPLSVVDGSGASSRTYDYAGRLASRTSQSGRSDLYGYTNGKLVSSISAYGTGDQRTEHDLARHARRADATAYVECGHSGGRTDGPDLQRHRPAVDDNLRGSGNIEHSHHHARVLRAGRCGRRSLSPCWPVEIGGRSSN